MMTDYSPPRAGGLVTYMQRVTSQVVLQLEKYFRWIAHLVGLLPVVLIGWAVLTNNQNLAINPLQFLTLRTGKAALIMVVITLACTPLNSLFGLKSVLKARRTFGLYAFSYALVHVSIFFGLDYLFNFRLIWKDLSDKRYILAGAGSFLILLPLAITSFRYWMKRLGKNWKRLHRLVYLGAVLAVVHYLWLVKTDIRLPLVYGAGVLVLLVMRLSRVRKFMSSLRFSRRG